MNKKEALKIYKENQEKFAAYSLLLRTAYFDRETIAPIKGNNYRNKMLSYMSGEAFTISTNPEYVETVKFLSNEKLDQITKRNVELSKKSLDNIINFSKEDVVEYDLACMESYDAWLQAKRNNEYQKWAPHLIKLIELSKKRAKIRNSKVDPYNLYLDDYEEGMNKKEYDKFFALIKKELIPLIKKVNKNQAKVNDSFINKYYPKEIQEKFCKEVLLKYLNFDPAWGYMGISEHPFTNPISTNDVRITTAYDEHNITTTLFSIIHEVGHAYYEHQVDEKYAGTPIQDSISSGMHESQSRFLENYLGRRKSFWKKLYPVLQSYFKENLGDVSLDEFVKAINASKSSLIRTDADELTYPIHILIRYEIEKDIFNGKVDLNNLNKIWNEKYKKYLGVEVPNDSKGIMQDIHWSDASFGYFPTYALGSAIGAQLLHTMEKEIDVDALLEKGQFNKVTKYLKDKLQHYGALYNYQQLLNLCCKEDFNPQYYIDYLKNKYTKLYL